MRGRPLRLWLQDGKELGTGVEAAVYFKVTPGLISQRIEEARDEGRPYAIVNEQRVYTVDPKTSRRRDPPPQAKRRPEGILLYGHVTRANGQIFSL